jgi:protein TonB
VAAAGDAAAPLAGDLIWAEQLPEVLEHVAPEYPEPARRTNTEGTVYVQVLAGDDGNVRDAIVLTGPPSLRDASLDAVWRWKFKPALTSGRPVAVWLVVPVTFRLR